MPITQSRLEHILHAAETFYTQLEGLRAAIAEHSLAVDKDGTDPAHALSEIVIVSYNSKPDYGFAKLLGEERTHIKLTTARNKRSAALARRSRGVEAPGDSAYGSPRAYAARAGAYPAITSPRNARSAPTRQRHSIAEKEEMILDEDEIVEGANITLGASPAPAVVPRPEPTEAELARQIEEDNALLRSGEWKKEHSDE